MANKDPYQINAISRMVTIVQRHAALFCNTSNVWYPEFDADEYRFCDFFNRFSITLILMLMAIWKKTSLCRVSRSSGKSFSTILYIRNALLKYLTDGLFDAHMQ